MNIRVIQLANIYCALGQMTNWLSMLSKFWAMNWRGLQAKYQKQQQSLSILNISATAAKLWSLLLHNSHALICNHEPRTISPTNTLPAHADLGKYGNTQSHSSTNLELTQGLSHNCTLFGHFHYIRPQPYPIIHIVVHKCTSFLAKSTRGTEKPHTTILAGVSLDTVIFSKCNSIPASQEEKSQSSCQKEAPK